MEAVQRGMAQGKRRVGVVLAVVLFGLLASGSVGYLIRYATATAPGSSTPAVQRAVTQPGNPVGDQWWQDATNPAAPQASAGDRWWQDPQFAAPSGAVPQRNDTRVRAY